MKRSYRRKKVKSVVPVLCRDKYGGARQPSPT
jgi:hypothetical protein